MEREIEQTQIDAAVKLHSMATGWQKVDGILRKLREIDPDVTDNDAAWLKMTAINKYYRAGVWGKHIEPLAKSIVAEVNVKRQSNEEIVNFDFVQRVLEKVGKEYSVAVSKFAHFFMDESLFPILDSYAEKAAKFHIGRKKPSKIKETRYQIFCENINRLKTGTMASLSNRTLDRYLWLAGQYMAWRFQGKAGIDAEIKGIFENHASEAILQELFPYKKEGGQWIRVP